MVSKISPGLCPAAFLVVSGCSTSASVILRTDADGKINSTRIKKSSGDAELDVYAMQMSRRYFVQEVKHPRANHTYVQKVKCAPAMLEERCEVPNRKK